MTITREEAAKAAAATLDVAALEKVDAGIDALIARRATGKDRANAEAAWERAADARRAANQRQEMRAAWIQHYRCMALVHHDAAARASEAADKLEEGAA